MGFQSDSITVTTHFVGVEMGCYANTKTIISLPGFLNILEVAEITALAWRIAVNKAPSGDAVNIKVETSGLGGGLADYLSEAHPVTEYRRWGKPDPIPAHGLKPWKQSGSQVLDARGVVVCSASSESNAEEIVSAANRMTGILD